MTRFRSHAFLIAATVALPCAARPDSAVEPKQNFLLIAVEDLRHALASYGASHIRASDIDSLASSGRNSRRHYTQELAGPAPVPPHATKVPAVPETRPDRTNGRRHGASACPR